MKRWFTLAVCAVFAAACRDGSPVTGVEAVEQPRQLLGLISGVKVDPVLTGALALASPLERLEVLVTFDDAATSPDAVASAIRATGAGVIRFRHLPIVFALATPAEVVSISNISGVKSLYANKQLSYFLAESVPTIRADLVHGMGFTGKGVGIAIVDSGVDGLFSPDIAYPTRMVANVKLAGRVSDLVTFGEGEPEVAAELFLNNVATSETSSGHGTHVAGIAAGDGTGSGGKYVGVAPGANLVGVGAGELLFVFWSLAAWDYVLENQAKYNIQVVNNSWGAEGAYDPDDPTVVASKRLYDRGIAVVFAAGNSGPDEGTLNPYSASPWVLSVAAGCKTVSPDPTGSAASCEDGRSALLGDFSSRGTPGDALYHPDITAPGVHVVSTRALLGAYITGTSAPYDLLSCAMTDEHKVHYTCVDGTSMSAPHVTGTIALMEEASRGRLTPDQAYRAIVRTARPMPGYAEWEVGAGYLDAYAAVRYVRR